MCIQFNQTFNHNKSKYSKKCISTEFDKHTCAKGHLHQMQSLVHCQKPSKSRILNLQNYTDQDLLQYMALCSIDVVISK